MELHDLIIEINKDTIVYCNKKRLMDASLYFKTNLKSNKVQIMASNGDELLVKDIIVSIQYGYTHTIYNNHKYCPKLLIKMLQYFFDFYIYDDDVLKKMAVIRFDNHLYFNDFIKLISQLDLRESDETLLQCIIHNMPSTQSLYREYKMQYLLETYMDNVLYDNLQERIHFMSFEEKLVMTKGLLKNGL